VTEIGTTNPDITEPDELSTLLDRVEDAVSTYIANVKQEHIQ